ncbi:MAG: CoA pyrophosphatase [Saprospiraceae bacterium]|nr:CoA pyrophosphatase [Saprospiraceae bacterium]
MKSLIEKIERRMKFPLPGQEAHLRMAHITRRHYVGAPPDARQAAVLLALFPKQGEWHIVLIERNANDRDQHGGQIGFPGGKAEPFDDTMLATALREATEEVGILKSQVNVLGGLTELYIPVSNFQVHPFLGYLDEQPSYQLQAEEVNAVLEAPLSHFQSASTRRVTDIKINSQLTLKNVPYFELQGRVLWGATAMMLSELLEILQGD